MIMKMKSQYSKNCGMQPKQHLEGNLQFYMFTEEINRYKINDFNFYSKKLEKED